MVLLIDNYDSFTYMLKDYIEQCNVKCEVVRNDEGILAKDINKYQAVVISPGPETPQKAGELMPFLQKTVYEKPILGICLGHQAIGELFGAHLQHADIPRHGKVDDISHNGDELFNNIPVKFSATRYHSLVLTNVTEPLTVTAQTATNEVMAIRHNKLPVWGIQFHPESCLTDHGINIIQNFLLQADGKY